MQGLTLSKSFKKYSFDQVEIPAKIDVDDIKPLLSVTEKRI